MEKQKEIEKKNNEELEYQKSQTQLEQIKFNEQNKIKIEQHIIYKRHILSKSTRR